MRGRPHWTKKFIVTILCAWMVSCLVACGQGGKVTFQDPLVERCVREALGKSATDPVTKKECAGITELTIHSSKDLGLSFDRYRLCVEPRNYVDLSDLQYLTGLKELKIVPFVSSTDDGDVLVGLENVKACKKLEKLSFVADRHYVETKMGYKYLADVVKDLPKLETLDLGYEMPERYQECFNETISFSHEEEAENGYLYWVGIVYEMGMKQLDELPDDVEDVILKMEPGAEIDMEDFTRFKHLKTLTLWGQAQLTIGDRDYKENELFEIKNVDALKKNQELFSLNVSGAYGDLDGIGSLSQLKELSIYQSIVEDVKFLGKLQNLRELTFCMNCADDVQDFVTQKNFPKLTYLCVDNTEFDNLDKVAEMKNLKMICFKNYGIKKRGSNGIIPADEVAKCKKLQYLELDYRSNVNVGDLNQLKDLKTLCLIAPQRLSGMEDVLELPNLYCVYFFAPVPESGEKDDKLLRKASEMPKMSVFINGQYATWIGVLWNREGQEAVKQFARERQKGYKACYDAHVLCEGYDVLTYWFGVDSAEELEEILSQ